MRTILCFVVLCSPAYGAVALIYDRVLSNGGLASGGPVDPAAVVNVLGGSDDETWLFPIDGSEIGSTITLNESNAAGFGFDWDNANELLRHTVVSRGFAHGVSVFGFHQIGGAFETVNPDFHDVVLDRIEYRMLSYSVTPAGPGQTQVSVRQRVSIYANVPEPTAIVLLTSLGLLFVRRHR